LVLRGWKGTRLKWKGGGKENEMKRLDRGEEERDSPVAEPGEGPEGPGPPYFQTKIRPEGPKNVLGDRPPLI